mmetsp:Transcript_22515/g.64792  ORF Transcript_22515/g.64792 Transcript_22515/m.64792 type:complete len:312 (+) Transcript_22515:231-1166(+)
MPERLSHVDEGVQGGGHAAGQDNARVPGELVETLLRRDRHSGLCRDLYQGDGDRPPLGAAQEAGVDVEVPFASLDAMVLPRLVAGAARVVAPTAAGLRTLTALRLLYAISGRPRPAPTVAEDAQTRRTTLRPLAVATGGALPTDVGLHGLAHDLDKGLHNVPHLGVRGLHHLAVRGVDLHVAGHEAVDRDLHAARKRFEALDLMALLSEVHGLPSAVERVHQRGEVFRDLATGARGQRGRRHLGELVEAGRQHAHGDVRVPCVDEGRGVLAQVPPQGPQPHATLLRKVRELRSALDARWQEASNRIDQLLS